LPINGGFGWANNQAILTELARTDPPEFILLLNPDAFVSSTALQRLCDLLLREPRAAAVGSLLTDDNGQALGSAFHFPSLATEFSRGSATGLIQRLMSVGDGVVRSASACECDWATGASVLFRTAALRDYGIFDDGFFLYFEETELMWRLRKAGWSIWHEPASVVQHVGGASTGVTGHLPELIVRRRPAYWYRSRTRYFAVTRGRTVATLSTLAWLAGRLVLQLRRLLGLGRGSKSVDREVRDMLRHCLAPVAIAQDATADQRKIGQPPAWLATADPTS